MLNENNSKIEMKGISIRFSGVKALSDIDFTIKSGEIRALIGANGAGKSTLMKVLAGVNPTYEGKIYIDGTEIEIRNPKEAKKNGIEIVYQEVDTALIPYLTVAENIMLNSIVNKMGKKQWINWEKIRKTANETLKKLNISIDVNKHVNELTLAQKQIVLIARAIAEKCKFLILDEPTAPLSEKETKELFDIVIELSKKDNVGIIFISHRLNELFEICETITVMRDGKIVDEKIIDGELTTKKIVELMLGEKTEEQYTRKELKIGEEILRIEQLCEKRNKIKNINLNVKKGEIVGISGLVGAGKTELCKTIFGEFRSKSGKIMLHNIPIKLSTPHSAVKNGIVLIPEERRKEGIFVENSVCENLSVVSLFKYCNKFGFINKKEEREKSIKIIKNLGIKVASENQKVKYLSGGNQQKVAVGKWMISDADIYVFDEPTKGVDVGAKKEIFKLIENLAEIGKGIIYASCEFNEILSIAHRTYVMYDGEIVKELLISDTNEEELLYYSTGGY